MDNKKANKFEADLLAHIEEVLVAYKTLLNDSLALDFCGIHGKDRVLILSHPVYKQKSRQIRAKQYIEEIEQLDETIQMIQDNPSGGGDADGRIGDSSSVDTRLINLQIKAQEMRRGLRSLSAGEVEIEEADAINVFFVPLTKEEFEIMSNVEVHEGAENNNLMSDIEDESPLTAARQAMRGKGEREGKEVELKDRTIEFINEEGDKVIEEII